MQENLSLNIVQGVVKPQMHILKLSHIEVEWQVFRFLKRQIPRL